MNDADVVREALEEAFSSVHWTLNLPVLDLRAVAAALAPPGDWVTLDAVIAMLEAVRDRLLRLMPSSSGDYVAVVSRDLRQAGLVRIELRNRRLRLEPRDAPPTSTTSPAPGTCGVTDAASASGTVGENASPVPAQDTGTNDGHAAFVGAPRCECARHDRVDEPDTTFAAAASGLRPAWDDVQIQDNTHRSVDVANEIKRRFDAGELTAAEDFLAALSRSPDTGLTRRFLGELGRHELSIATGGRTVLTGGRTRFPRTLETRTVYAVVLEQFCDVNASCLRGRLVSVHADARDDIARTVLRQRAYTINISTCRDALLIRHAALADCRVEALVTGTYNLADGTIDAMTLKAVSNRSHLRPLVERNFAQLQIEFDQLP